MAKVGKHLLKQFVTMLQSNPVFRIVLDDG